MYTLGSLALFIKEIMPDVEKREMNYKDEFYSLGSEEDIRKGLISFRVFMENLYDELSNNQEYSTIERKGDKRMADETTLTVEFPVLNNIKSVLLNIGEYGQLSNDGTTILMSSYEKISLKRSYNKNSTAKISNAQVLKAMRFLEACGIRFEGVDLTVKRLQPKIIDTITISYPNDATFLFGLQLMTITHDKYATRELDDVFLRCDHRVLSKEILDEPIIKSYLKPLNDEYHALVADLHKSFTDAGLTCSLDLNGFCIHLVYYNKKKVVAKLSKSFSNKYRLIVKTKKMEKYPNVIEDFNGDIKHIISRGYGCDRKSGTTHGNCQRGCQGFKLPFNENLLENKENVANWIHAEMTCK